MAFSKFNLNKQIYQAIEDAGYQTPTGIQDLAIPIVLNGHDLIGIAQTGTGKTAAYVLPMLYNLKYAQGNYARAVIFAPTRELVIQISKEVTKFSVHTDLRSVVLYGGIGPKSQKEQLAKGVDIIVTTPGRFLDLYSEGDINTKNLKVLVLDEADKMMDMGFMTQIRNILEVVPTKRQNLLFTATFPEKVEKLSAEFLEYPMKVEVTPQATAAETVIQSVYEVENFQTKLNFLRSMLEHEDLFTRVMVFVKTKSAAERIFNFLQGKLKGSIKLIHANKGQNSRINAMDEFRAGNVRLLIATDVACRGIDIPKVSHVINFDVPMVYDDYVHRIGRTGRAEEIGEAITLVTMADEPHFQRIEKLIRQKHRRLALPPYIDREETPYEEKQEMLRHLDTLKKKADPEYQGAFHEKKYKPHPKPAPKSSTKSGAKSNATGGKTTGTKSSGNTYGKSSKPATGSKTNKFANKRKSR